MCLCTDFFCLISFVIYEKISSFANMTVTLII